MYDILNSITLPLFFLSSETLVLFLVLLLRCSNPFTVSYMSITATAFKSLTMADSCLLSSPSSPFHNITKSHVFSHPSKPLTLQFSCLNSSPSLSLSLAARTHRSPVLTHVAQTSDWAQQEDNTATFQAQEEEQEGGGLLDWEVAGEGAEDEGFVEPPEEAKLFVGNLPYDVDSQKLAMLFEQAGVVEIAEVRKREACCPRNFQYRFWLMLFRV